MNENKKQKKGSKGLIILMVVLCVLLILVCLLLVFSHFYGMLDYRDASEFEGTTVSPEMLRSPEETPDPNAEEIGQQEIEALQQEMASGLEDDPIAQKGVYNVLLLGSDSRMDDFKNRTDTMMLVSVNKNTGEIVLTSFMRDIYIYIPDWGYQRLNVANVAGGPGRVMQTIEQNFGVSIDNYAFVNFYSFMDVVDTLGGIDISLSDGEVYYINIWVNDPDLQVEPSRRSDLQYEKDGQYHLNGIQALAYCRTRNIGGDMGRTERQRKVMGLIWDKVQGMSVSTLKDLAETILPQITTDISETTCLSILADLPAYKDFQLVSQCVPTDNTYNFVNIGGMSVVSIDMEANQQFLQDSIYGAQ